jgi:hypothetical protein
MSSVTQAQQSSESHPGGSWLHTLGPALVVIAIAMAQLTQHFWLLGHGESYVVTALAIDDTYYYLQTAWNLTHSGIPSFDGVHATNGVQMLWFAIVTLLAAISPDKVTLLFVAMGTTAILLAACHLPIWLLGRSLRRPDLAIVASALWAGVTLSRGTLFSGMENSLHALVFWVVVWQVAIWFIRLEKGEPPNAVGLSIALVLNTWTRLDAGLFSAVIFAICVSRLWMQGGLRQYRHVVTTALQIAMAGALVQVSFYLALAGTPVPISTLVKLGWSCPVDPLWAVVQCDVSWADVQKGTLLSFPYLPRWVLLPALVAIGVALRFVRSSERWWVGCLLAGTAVQVVVIVIQPTYGTFSWYHSALFIVQVMVLAYTASVVFHATLPRPALQVFSAAAAAAVLFATSSYSFVAYKPSKLVSGYVLRYEVAQWIAENTPKNVVLAAWNSGQLAYFSDRRTLNLDGLISSPAYYRQVLREHDPAALESFLTESGVDYIVDYIENDLTTSLPQLKAFENDNLKIVLWEYGSKEIEAVTPEVASGPVY